MKLNVLHGASGGRTNCGTGVFKEFSVFGNALRQ